MDDTDQTPINPVENGERNDAEAGPSQSSSSIHVPDKRENEILVNADDDDQWNDGGKNSTWLTSVNMLLFLDICRVCRVSGDDSSPLFHPCLCTGSIKYVHQHCLLEWLKCSKKSVCELCNHKFIFQPVYREDMPEQLPIREIAYGMPCLLYTDLSFILGIFSMIYRYIRLFLIYCLAFVCWLGIVPLVACRVHRYVIYIECHQEISVFQLKKSNF